MTSRHSPDRDKDKIQWSGKVISVQPRIRLIRSFDQRSHGYLGYALEVYGIVGGKERTFDIGIGKGAAAKYQFRVGDIISGKSEVVPDPRTEVVEYYKTSELKVVERGLKREFYLPLGTAYRLSWKYIGSEVIGGWTHALTKGNARVVFGVVKCLSRLLSIIGTRAKNNIDSKHSVTVQKRVTFIRQVRGERSKAGRVWCGKNRTGLTMTLFLIEGWMIRVTLR